MTVLSEALATHLSISLSSWFVIHSLSVFKVRHSYRAGDNCGWYDQETTTLTNWTGLCGLNP